MTELTRLIERLQRGISKGASYIKSIKHPHLLVISLKELNNLIGNDKVKDSVATQVSHLIMVKARANKNSGIKEDQVMLNTLLTGQPGTGKTTVGIKLAKIWYSLGFLDGSKNPKEKKQGITGVLGDILKEGTGTSDETTLTIYIMFVFLMVLFTILSLAWSFYNKFGGTLTLILVGVMLFLFLIVGYYVYWQLNSDNTTDTTKNTNKNKDNKNISDNKNINQEISTEESERFDNIVIPSDDQIIKVVTRADFVDKYVGWTSIKTNKLLEENLGKVLFVDEAYSLINGPHDEFGMEALTALNLFLSQRSREIIVIFAGYKDLMETGPFSVQPGLKRRFMWQFESNGYTSEQLFEIFKLQLNSKGWGMTDEEASLAIFTENEDAFPAFGGDTERAGFFAELEHSRDFISNEKGMIINKLEPKHIIKGIDKLRENNFSESNEESTNPLANMMKLMSGKNKKNNKPTKSSKTSETKSSKTVDTKPIYHEESTNPDESETDLMDEIKNNIIQKGFR